MKKLQLANTLPPLPRTYWVCERLLLAGAYAGQPVPAEHKARLQGLFDAGIRTVINLMEERETNNDGEPFARYEEDLQLIAAESGEQVQCLRFPIVDRDITTQAQMRETLDAIDGSIIADRPVYVHCFGGIGRTGTAICCWLLRHGLASKSNVFEVLSELRKADKARATWPAPENNTQRIFVLGWPEQSQTAKRVAATPVVLRNDWFTRLFGFSERSPQEVREHIQVNGSQLTSLVNGKAYQCGQLEILSLADLRERSAAPERANGKFQLSELIGDAKGLHADKSNAGAVFQVASQFNLLEMVAPSVTPEEGIGIYEGDPTQGPACAIACGAGTVFRNYFVSLPGDDGASPQIGQTAKNQIDCLIDLGKALGNDRNQLWKMQNGYALPTAEGLREIDSKLRSMSEPERDALRAKLKIGVQWNSQVTLDNCSHTVTQVYGSALPVAYSDLPVSHWESFARLVLEASYEATLAVAALNGANKSLYLTLLGGGAFGNEPEWIIAAIDRACRLYQSIDLDVKIVSYRRSIPAVSRLVADFNR